MRTIYKYEIPLAGEAVVLMPKYAQLLKFAMQFIEKNDCAGNLLCVWAVVDTGNEPEERIFQIFGTGHPLPENAVVAWGIDDGHSNYRDTILDGPFVWHIFEKNNPKPKKGT
jgi:hypothetical protein